MTADPRARLTPALALDCLRELSLGVETAVVLDAAGAPLAGDARLADRATRLLASTPDGSVAREPADGGALLLAVRDGGGVAIAVLAGPRALVPLLEHDIRTLLADLAPPGSQC
jgi:hypothetical protein